VRRKLVLAGAGFFVLMGVALVVLRMQMSPAKSPRLYVPGPFKSLRDTPGHVAHIRDHKVKCTECHDLDRHGFQVPNLDLCQRCHPDQVSTIHVGSPLAASVVDCQSCHTFSEDRSIQPHNCIRCHAEAQSMARPIVTHAEVKCDECHRPHTTPSLVPRTCDECHEDLTGVKHARRVAGAMLCLDCHGVHDTEMEADARCRTCHTGAIAKTATFDGHDKCASCHAPHDFSRAGVRACENCHDGQVVLASQKVKKHRACDACHDEHAVAPKRARARCQSCHARVAPHHPPDDAGGACLGCHPAHDLAKVTGAVVPCIQCHTEARTVTSNHSNETRCDDCHKTHAFALDATDAKLCGRCHGDERRLTARAKNNGHATCVNCHKQAAHTPKSAPPACTTCHETQRKTAPKGHDKCGDCHETHSGDVRKQCRDCHEDQRTGMHSRGVKNDCAACHRPHGPSGPEKPPACTTCHVPTKLPLLHTVAEHQTCKDCHTPHEKSPRNNRAACTAGACHSTIQGKPQSRHEPAAKACSGCHVFGRGRVVAP
jgi:hypothetical protein